MCITLLDKIYNKENYWDVLEDFEEASKNDEVNFNSEGELKGDLRLIVELYPYGYKEAK